MKDKGYDLNALLDGIVVTRVHHFDSLNELPIVKGEPFTITEEKVFMLNDPKAVKPNKDYYIALRKVAKKLNPKAKRVVHVDDKKENIDGANKVDDVKGILFFLPSGSARKSTPEQIEKAVQGYKEGLKEQGISAK